MQIGNNEIDQFYQQAVVPALIACELEPKRVDKHNEGGLLKSEIVKFIQGSDIIVADLTNERPNCYLEVGYAIGIDKLRNLILTAREDHNPNSQNYKVGGPKIHFDLIGYDILFWNGDQLDVFREKLERKIRGRQAIIAPAGAPRSWDEEWLTKHRSKAREGLQKTNLPGFMEACSALLSLEIGVNQKELLDAAEFAQIHTFGWPIGVVLSNRDDSKPRPAADGIVAEIVRSDLYDYWALRRNGDFYFLGSLFEDGRRPGCLFFDTRIVRVTEAVLHSARLYSRLEVPNTAPLRIGVRHGGMRDRVLVSASPHRLWPYEDRNTTEDEVYSEVHTSLAEIESNLVDLVKRLLQPLFVGFNFDTFDDGVYSDIVNRFVQGKTS